MQADKGRLYYATGIDNSQLAADATQAKNLLHGIGQQAAQKGNLMESAFKRVGTAVAGMFAISQIKEFASQIISVRGEIQSMEVAFQTLLGNKEKADAMFSEIRQFAVSTPMMMKDLASGAQQMLAFGIEADKVMPMLRALGDISMGDSQKFQSLTLAFSQMSATGKLMGQDLLQMINAGFNPLQIIAEQTGKSIGELKDEMSKGAISAEMVADAFIAATSEGGKFHNMLANMSSGVEGQTSNLKGAVEDMMNEIGEKMQGVYSAAITGGTSLVQNYEEVAEAALALAGVIGTYKAAIVVCDAAAKASATAAAANSAAIVAANEAQFAAIGKVATAELSQIEVQLQDAVAKKQLTAAQAEQILASQAAAAARIAEMQATAAQLQMDVASATSAEVAAKARFDASVVELKAAGDRLLAAQASGDMIAFEAAQAEIDAAAQQRDTAAKELNAASTSKAAAAAKADAAAKEAEAAATQLNSASMTTEATTTSALTVAKQRLLGAVRKLYATISAHPYAIIAAAIAAVAYATYKLITAETEAEKAQRKLNETTSKYAAEAMSEQAELDALFKTLKSATEGSNAYAAAKQTLIDKYGKYLDGLIDEEGKVKDLEVAYNRLTSAIKRSANARALDEATTEAKKDLSENQEKAIKKIVEILSGEHNGKEISKDLQNNLLGLIRREYESAGGYMTDATERMIGNLFGENKGVHGWKGGSVVQQLRKQVGDMRRAQEVYDNTIQDANNKFGERDNDFVSWSKDDLEAAQTQLEDMIKANDVADLILYNQGKQIATYKDIVEAKNALLDVKQAIKEKDAEADASSSTSTSKKLTEEEKKKLAAAAKKANHAKIEVAERNEAIEAAKNAEIKATRDAQLQIDQERLNLQSDSTEKSLAQIELDKRRMEAAIEDREQALLDKYRDIKKEEWERDNPNAKDKGLRFDRSTISMDDMKAAASETGNEWLAGALAAIDKSKEIVETTTENSLDTLFNSWIDQFGNYYQRREKLTNQWELILQGLPVQYMEEAVRAMNEQLGTLQMDKIKEDLNWDDVFSNLQNMSTQAIDAMISKLRAYKGMVNETYDPKLIKEYDAAMRKLESAKRATSKGLWDVFVPQAFKERMEAEAELAAAQARHNELVEEQKKKETEVAAKVQDIVTIIKEITGKEISVDIIQDPAKLQKVIDNIKLENPVEGANLQNLAGDLGQTQGELNGITKAAGDAGQAIQGMQSAGSGIMATMAQVGAIVQKVNESVQSASKLVHDLSDTADALGADTSVGSGWDTATTIMDGFAEASEGATQAFQSLMSGNPIGVIQGIVQSFTGWIKAFAKINDSKHERNILQMQEQIDDLQTSYDLLGHEIDKTFGKDASALIDQQTQMLENQKQLIQMQIAEEEAKKNSDDDKIKEWRNQLKELNNDIEDSKAAAIDAIFGEDINSAIERLADGLTDAWGEGKEGAQSAHDAVRTMMQQMVSESIKAAMQSTGQMERIRKKLQEFYSDNVLQPWEQQQIYDMAEQLQKELDAQYGWSKSLFETDDEEERTAAQKGIASASQDSVDELNGRATAIQGHTFSISENTKLLLSNVQAILRSVMNIENETDGFGGRMERIEGNIKTMTNTLDDIATRGIRMKS